MNKKFLFIGGFFLLIVAGVSLITFYPMQSMQSNAIEMHQENEKTVYTITQKEGQYITIQSKDLRTNTSEEELSTRSSQLLATITYKATFGDVKKEGKVASEIRLSVSDTKYGELDSYGGSRSFDTEYCAFVPYTQYKNKAVGVFVFSNRQQTIEAVKKDPEKAKDKISQEDVLLEQIIELKER
ncbi:MULTISPECIES: hypothetical protein [Enterococcus]|uniref:Uncharacterized protein n=1 Tax=Enterococcus sulfureus ATCC 49903 TaxID=1140003 RepID=S0P0R3_9ENTE|nr:hypothetical protein [Enterococcus sulfureus]EOT46940.1 hypothetical protein OMY_01190 [Enterococcus sulfureus ATCC 49903]EOT83765.1 hypothetical protein I573_01490 [Enterococcus sulfureus ATCC 49903]